MKLFTSTLITAAAALTLAGAAQAQVTVTTGGGYIKMVEALTAQYEKDTGAKVEKAFGGNIGQMLAQVESGSPVTVVISDATSLKKFTNALNADAGVRLGDTPLILIWRKGLTLASPEDLTSDAVKRVAMPDPKAAVYGRAAKEYLDGSGLAEKIAGKLNVVSHGASGDVLCLPRRDGCGLCQSPRSSSRQRQDRRLCRCERRL